MSDTTITSEERALWLAEAQPKNIDYYEPIDFELDKRIRKLIGALEQAEARVKSRNNHIHRLLGEALESERNLDGMKSRLQEAEARAEKAEKELADADAEISELRDELEDSRGTEKDAPNILCAIARLVGVYEHCQEIGDDMGEMTLDAARDLLADKQTAEAKVARLTKERDWLAEKVADLEDNSWTGNNSQVGKFAEPEYCLKEAARRAVAAGEEPCQK